MDSEVSREEQSSFSPPRNPNWGPIIWTDILRLDIRIQEFMFKISVSDVNHFLCNVVGFFVFFFTLVYFTIQYWFCHTLTWIHHECATVPKHESPSHLPPHNISLCHPHAPAPSILYPASDIDWRVFCFLYSSHFSSHTAQCWSFYLELEAREILPQFFLPDEGSTLSSSSLVLPIMVLRIRHLKAVYVFISLCQQ